MATGVPFISKDAMTVPSRSWEAPGKETAISRSVAKKVFMGEPVGALIDSKYTKSKG